MTTYTPFDGWFERPKHILSRRRIRTDSLTDVYLSNQDSLSIIMNLLSETLLSDGNLETNENIVLDLEYYENNEHNHTCSICQEDVCINEVVTKLSCNHVFHKNCIVEWGKVKQECPTCRNAMPFHSSAR